VVYDAEYCAGFRKMILMNKVNAGVLILWGISLLFSYIGFSFYPDWLDVVWILALGALSSIVIWRLWENTNKYYLFPIIILVFLIFIDLSGWVRQPSKIYDSEKDRYIKAYVEITGFMDAGTSFFVYKKVQALPFLERKYGYAINWETDYINRRPEARVLLTENFIIVYQGEFSDTIVICFDEFGLDDNK